jgi:hypothetical protein
MAVGINAPKSSINLARPLAPAVLGVQSTAPVKVIIQPQVGI